MSEEQFSREEFTSAKEERRQEIQNAFNPDRMKVIRKELFASLRDPAVTIRKDSITFNTACINGLEDAVYVRLMLDEELGFLSVTACDENDKHALRWCVAKPDKRKSRKMRCPEFSGPLFKKFGWSDKCRYKVLGYRIEYDGDTYYVFDLNVKQIFNEKPKKGEEPVDENGEETPVDTRTGYYPDDIANTFGVPMEQYKKENEIKDMDGFVTIAAFTGTEKPDQEETTTATAEDSNVEMNSATTEETATAHAEEGGAEIGSSAGTAITTGAALAQRRDAEYEQQSLTWKG